MVVIFPEGTSTDGHHVLPFFPALLGPVVAGGLSVTPAWLGYQVAGNDAAKQIGYGSGMPLLPHLLNLLTIARIDATVAFGPPHPAGSDGRLLARRLRDEVIQLGRRHGVSSTSIPGANRPAAAPRADGLEHFPRGSPASRPFVPSQV